MGLRTIEVIMMRREKTVFGKMITMDRPYFDSCATHAQAVTPARVGDAPHFGSTCPP